MFSGKGGIIGDTKKWRVVQVILYVALVSSTVFLFAPIP